MKNILIICIALISFTGISQTKYQKGMTAALGSEQTMGSCKYV